MYLCQFCRRQRRWCSARPAPLYRPRLHVGGLVGFHWLPLEKRKLIIYIDLLRRDNLSNSHCSYARSPEINITESSKMLIKLYPPYRREGLWARPRSPGICLSASSAGNSPRPPPMSGAVVHWQCLARGHRRRSGDHRHCRPLRRSHQVLHLGRLARSQQLPPLGGLEVRNRISRKWIKVICLKKEKLL